MIKREMVKMGAKFYKREESFFHYEVLKIEFDPRTKLPCMAYLAYCAGSSSKIDMIYLTDNTLDGLEKWFVNLSDAYADKAARLTYEAKQYDRDAKELKAENR